MHFPLFFLLVPGELLARAHSDNQSSADSLRETIKVFLCPTLPVCLPLCSVLCRPQIPKLIFGHVSPPLVCRKTIIWAFMFKLYHCYCQTLDSALISQWREFSVPNNPVHKFYFNSNGLLSTWCAFYHRYEQPKCDGNARAHPTKPKDHYRSRHLQGASLKLHRFHLVESAAPVQPCRTSQSCNSKAKVLVSASAFADIIRGAAQRNAW